MILLYIWLLNAEGMKSAIIGSKMMVIGFTLIYCTFSTKNWGIIPELIKRGFNEKM